MNYFANAPVTSHHRTAAFTGHRTANDVSPRDTQGSTNVVRRRADKDSLPERVSSMGEGNVASGVSTVCRSVCDDLDVGRACDKRGVSAVGASVQCDGVERAPWAPACSVMEWRERRGR